MQNDMSPICIATGKNTEGVQEKSRTKPIANTSFDSSSEDDGYMTDPDPPKAKVARDVKSVDNERFVQRPDSN